MFETMSGVGEARRLRHLAPLRIADEGAPALLARGERVVHEQVEQAGHPRPRDHPREEHGRQPGALEDGDLAELLEHLDLLQVRLLAGALVDAQLEDARRLRRRLRRQLDARKGREGLQQPGLLPHVGRIGGGRIGVRRGCGQVVGVLGEGVLEREERRGRCERRQREQARLRRAGDRLEDADGAGAGAGQRRDAGLGEVFTETARLAGAQRVVLPDVEARRGRGRGASRIRRLAPRRLERQRDWRDWS